MEWWETGIDAREWALRVKDSGTNMEDAGCWRNNGTQTHLHTRLAISEISRWLWKGDWPRRTQHSSTALLRLEVGWILNVASARFIIAVGTWICEMGDFWRQVAGAWASRMKALSPSVSVLVSFLSQLLARRFLWFVTHRLTKTDRNVCVLTRKPWTRLAHTPRLEIVRECPNRGLASWHESCFLLFWILEMPQANRVELNFQLYK